MKTRALALASFVSILGAGCEPSPETFTMAPRTGHRISALAGARSTTMGEGDVLVLDTTPLDDDHDAMDLCVTATSSNPSVVEVRRVQGKCRVFVVSAKAGGSGSVTFHARDGEETLAITVAPLP